MKVRFIKIAYPMTAIKQTGMATTYQGTSICEPNQLTLQEDKRKEDNSVIRKNNVFFMLAPPFSFYYITTPLDFQEFFS